MLLDFIKIRALVFNASLLMFCNQLSSAEVAIIGGASFDDNSPYAALVSLSGNTIPLSGPGTPTGTGIIYSVAINDSGNAIIGGRDNGNTTPYFVLVSPSGVRSLISGVLPSMLGRISSVAINSSGSAIAGGRQGAAADAPYAAIINSSGVANAITGGIPAGPMGNINSVAINTSGAGIIGGDDSSAVYAAVVSPSGVATAITGPALPAGPFGFIQSVAINDSGAGIIGGNDVNNNTLYAAYVSPSGVTAPVTGAGVLGQGKINSVAINNSGTVVLGGFKSPSIPSNAFAAIVSSSGVADLSSINSIEGEVTSVAINSSGTAIIGGASDAPNNFSGAFVSPSGNITFLSVPIGNQSVAISDSGAAIVAGFDAGTFSNAAYLVAPSGALTPLSGLPMIGPLLSVDANNNLILNSVVPSSFSAGSGFGNSIFALASQIMPNHLAQYNGLWGIAQTTQEFKGKKSKKEIGLLAAATDVIKQKTPSVEEINYSLWGSAFGNYSHQKKADSIPSSSNWIGGAVLGFDYLGIDNAVIGGGAAYAYNYVHLSEGIGHAQINQEFLTLYGTWSRKNFFINVSLWGGLYQMHNVRHSIANITSTSNINGWLLSPHLEISTPFFAQDHWFAIAPFVMFDWANNWQGHVREHGASGFNLILDSQYTSLLRSEAGMNFFETMQYGWGSFTLKEKVSYVNKAPFYTGTSLASFVGSVSSFSIVTFSNQIQNLGAVQLNALFVPYSRKYPYGSINYQGEFGSSFQSHLVSIEIGKDF